MLSTRLRLIILFVLLLSLPLPGYCFDMEFMLRSMAWTLLWVAIGALAIVALIAATILLLKQLRKPEATNSSQKLVAGLRIGLLTLPATIVTYGIVTWFLYDQYGSWRYLVALGTGLLGIATCLLLWYQRRPTAAAAMLGGLLVVSVTANYVGWLGKWPTRKPPMPLGLLGNPVFADVSPPPEIADTSHVYAYVDQMPGFRGTGTALKERVRNELHYPDRARDKGVSGIVQVTFKVQTDGRLANIRVTQSLSQECDQEALRVLSTLELSFSPGSQNGQLVPVQETLSFGFGPTPATP